MSPEAIDALMAAATAVVVTQGESAEQDGAFIEAAFGPLAALDRDGAVEIAAFTIGVVAGRLSVDDLPILRSELEQLPDQGDVT